MVWAVLTQTTMLMVAMVVLQPRSVQVSALVCQARAQMQMAVTPAMLVVLVSVWVSAELMQTPATLTAALPEASLAFLSQGVVPPEILTPMASVAVSGSVLARAEAAVTLIQLAVPKAQGAVTAVAEMRLVAPVATQTLGLQPSTTLKAMGA